jgi:hypothetical protein
MRATLLYQIAAGQLELVALDADGDSERAETLRRRLVATIREVAAQDVSYRRRTRFRR